MLEVLKLNAEWLNTLLRLEDFKTFALIECCLRMGFFEFFEEPKTVEELSRELKLNYKTANAVCEFFKSKGLLLERDGKFVVSEVCAMLLSNRSPFSLARVFEEKRKEVEIWLRIENYLQGEDLRKEEDFFKTRILTLGRIALLKDLKFVFKVAELEEFKRAKRLLDLGGGHGLYAYAFTLLNDRLEAVVFDLPKVVRAAKDFLKPFKAERVSFVEGDFFKEDLGEGYDLVFSSFNPGGKHSQLIPKIYRALKKGGIYVNRQFFPKEGFGLEDLEWNLWSFERLKKGFKAYTFEGDLQLDEYIEELRKNGFEILEVLSEDYTAVFAKKI